MTRLAALSAVLLFFGCSLMAAELHLPGYVGNRAEHNAERVIIFVHGVLSDGNGAWTHANGAYFPALVADDPLFSDCDVWVYNYLTPRFSRSYDIEELSRDLQRRLEHDKVLANHRQLIFVSHSMGGLITRAFLLNSGISADRVAMLYFYATPTTGSELAALARYMSRNPQFRDMRPLTTVDPGILAKYEADWLRSDLRRVRSHCAYEVLPTRRVTVVVDRVSATHLCNMPLDPLARDHVDIVKPRDRDDDVYLVFRLAYEQLQQTTESGREAAWNLSSADQPLLRVCNVTEAPNGVCSDKNWLSEVNAKGGQTVGIAAGYRHRGARTARDVRLRIDVPRTPGADPDVSAQLYGTSTYPLFATAAVRTTQPVVLVPADGWSFPPGVNIAGPLPFGQEPVAAFQPSGLSLGDVSAGLSNGGSVVLYLRVMPVTVFAWKATESMAKKFESFVPWFSNVPNQLETIASSIKLSNGMTEYDVQGHPLRWTPLVESLGTDEAAVFYLYWKNDSSDTLRNLRVRAQTTSLSPTRVRVQFESRERASIVRTDAAVIDLAKAGTVARTGAFSCPANEQELQAAFSGKQAPAELKEDPAGDILLGDVNPSGTRIIALVYEPAPAVEVVH
jgi:pimeloyl-ACP methyl ester carboxylesterase